MRSVAPGRYSRPVGIAPLLTVAALSLSVHAINDGPCPGVPATVADGCYVEATEAIWVDGLPHNRLIVWHELGHAFDAQRMDDGERHAFSCLKGVHARDGDPSRCGAEWTGDLAEVFADAYGSCAIGAMPGANRFLDGDDYLPTAREHRQVCRFINRAVD